ncbi:MAG: ATP-dependent helicase [Candidatus Yanofskybacteria bacterium]|nr:ATP-dependent helicase [Candidatus Yanofskybacteria bacterium]
MPTSSEFERRYEALNPRQREAVDAVEGPVMVIAGPGTGKTAILTLRIANIMRHGTEPEAILALTYTVNAAVEMQQRLATIVGAAAYRITAVTFHGLCEKIIRDHEDRFADLAGRRVADAADRRRIMERLFADAPYLDLLGGFGDDPYYIDPALQTIEELKREGVSPERLTELVAAERIAIAENPENISSRGATKGQLKADAKLSLERMDRLDELVLLYRDYERVLAAEGLYDYSDMLTRVCAALEHDELLRLAVQERFQYILVDEHQDTNTVQNRIIELIAQFYDSPDLFIVGDEKQAIYRFQGASLDNFLYFKDRFRGVRLIVLTENYRSSQRILDVAHEVRPSHEPLTARAGHADAPIGLVAVATPDLQHYAVGRMIQDRIADGTQPGEIAVLYRRNSDGQELAGMLARMGVPYSIDASLDLLDDPDIFRLLLLLEAIREYGVPGPLYEALHVPWLGVLPLDLYKLNWFCGHVRNPYDVIASTPLMREAHLTEPERLVTLSHRLAGWHALAKHENPARTLETILEESGCLAAFLAHPESQQKLARLHSMYDIARDLVRTDRQATLLDFVDRIRYIRDKGIRLQMRTTVVPGRVRLMTAHSAKGLEFDSVFLIDCYEKHWPSPRRGSPLALPASVYRLRPVAQTDDAEAEERNLFFVALTRARKNAVICWPTHDQQGKELTPSRFIELLSPDMVETVDMKAVERNYAEQQYIRLTPLPARQPEIADREYLRDRFLQQGLSATGLNNYLACPWKYFYRNLVRIPEAPSAPLMYGSAVDRALERFFNARDAGEPVVCETLLAFFREGVREHPFSGRDFAEATAKGERALQGWYERHHAAWPMRSRQQVAISGIPIPDTGGATLKGTLDKLELLGDNRVRVVDFKTGRFSKAKTASDGDYVRQLTFYRALLDRWQDGRFTMTEGALDFIDPDARGTYHRVSFDITQKDGDALVEQAADVAQKILALEFWNARCDDPDCQYCQLREGMNASVAPA